MFRLKLHYLIVFAVNGCLVPFLPWYLRQKGLSDDQISSVMAVSALAVILSPVLVTFIADAHMDARRVMGSLLVLTSISLSLIPIYDGFWPILAALLAQSILYVPVVPLQDGFTFAMQERQRRAGQVPVGYHKIRVWGTIGFLIPGLLLLMLVREWGVVTVALYVAAAFAMAAGLNALFLPRIPREQQVMQRRLPTADAGRALFGKHMLVFCMACFLVQMAAASYYTFYPLYLEREAGINRAWAGMIMNIGVVVEIAFMLSFGRLFGKLGPRRFMLIACASMTLRMLLLAAFPNPAVAVGIQAFHGMMCLLMQVAPIVIIDRLAESRFRHSIQGLFAMTVLGGGRIMGNLLAGQVAKYGYQTTYWWAAGLVAAAALLLFIGYHPEAVEPVQEPQTAKAA